MGRRATGIVRTAERKDGETSFYARITAYGEPHEFKIGETPSMTAQQARDEVDAIMLQVRRGVWSPQRPTAAVEAPPAEPTFHEVLSDYVALRRSRRPKPSTLADLDWRAKHLLAFFYAPVAGYSNDGAPNFGAPRLFSEIDEDLVISFITTKEDERRDLRNLRARIKAGTVSIERLRGRDAWLHSFYGPSSKGLGETSVNAILATLRATIDRGMRRHEGLLTFNPAEGHGVDAPDPDRSVLEPDQIEVVLEAAAEMDTGIVRGFKRTNGRGMPDHYREDLRIGRESALATYIFCGLRNQEGARLRLQDCRLDEEVLHVTEMEGEDDDGNRRAGVKTKASIRYVHAPPIVRDILGRWLDYRRSQGARPGDLVWPRERSGLQRDGNSIRNRLLGRAVKQAKVLLDERDMVAMPARIRPHSFRRTFCSLLYLNGEGPDYVMGQMGHESARLALEVYQQNKGRRVRDPRIREWLGPPSTAQAAAAA